MCVQFVDFYWSAQPLIFGYVHLVELNLDMMTPESLMKICALRGFDLARNGGAVLVWLPLVGMLFGS